MFEHNGLDTADGLEILTTARPAVGEMTTGRQVKPVVRRATIHDVTAASDVSQMTVSHVFSGSRHVSEATA